MSAAHARLTTLVRTRLPGCPGLYREEIVRRLAASPVPPVLERQAVDEMARAVIRHQLTDYDRLMLTHGLTRDEARIAVEDEVTEWLTDWRHGARQ